MFARLYNGMDLFGVGLMHADLSHMCQEAARLEPFWHNCQQLLSEVVWSLTSLEGLLAGTPLFIAGDAEHQWRQRLSGHLVCHLTLPLAKSAQTVQPPCADLVQLAVWLSCVLAGFVTASCTVPFFVEHI